MLNNLPKELLSKIYYYTCPIHPCKQEIIQQHKIAEIIFNKIKNIYSQDNIFNCSDEPLSSSCIIYLTNLLSVLDIPSIVTIDIDTLKPFIYFY